MSMIEVTDTNYGTMLISSDKIVSVLSGSCKTYILTIGVAEDNSPLEYSVEETYDEVKAMLEDL